MFGSDGYDDDVYECKATVKWFNATKGFGFVQPEDGSPDAFLHISVLSKYGVDSVGEGQSMSCEIGAGKKGPDVKRILDLGDAPAAAPRSASRPASRGGDAWEGAGHVKFFNEVKGFGMVTLEDGRDVFIGDRTLKPLGIDALEVNEAVRAMVTEGPRGLMVVEVIAVGDDV